MSWWLDSEDCQIDSIFKLPDVRPPQIPLEREASPHLTASGAAGVVHLLSGCSCGSSLSLALRLSTPEPCVKPHLEPTAYPGQAENEVDHGAVGESGIHSDKLPVRTSSGDMRAERRGRHYHHGVVNLWAETILAFPMRQSDPGSAGGCLRTCSKATRNTPRRMQT
jgi:hypothetical protein